MQKKTLPLFLIPLIISVAFGFFSYQKFEPSVDLSKFEIYKVDLTKNHIELYWKDEKGEPYKNFSNLKNALKDKNKILEFAMNGGMYHPDNSPVGLYIEKGKELIPINTASCNGNFCLKPNGVFCIRKDNKAAVIETSKFDSDNTEYATQSGPMLVIDNKIHHAFNENSTNVNIRNGVGVASPTEVYFVISKTKVTFYEMAQLFKDHLKCSNALYLDGFVSKMYLPERKWNDLDGNFGPIIGISK